MPAAKKPKIEYYWSLVPHGGYEHFVNWRLVGANGEIVCQSTQGARDKTDAQRSVRTAMDLMGAEKMIAVNMIIREVGPGKKPS